MTTSVQPAATGQMAGRPTPTGLADVIDTILDRGLVIDAYVRVSLVGIEVLTIDARVVVASVDTYLRFAEAANRVDMSQTGEKGLPEVLEDTKGAAGVDRTKNVVQGALEAADEKLTDIVESHTARRKAPRSRRDEREEEE
ncbi:gas vesicle protein [Nonomuraea phyllanthi]|uniref:Gas vesicle protein A n=1 Tax=Nonomuraea phyllanthi TaxID=2219224 RepID=A0A5C4WXZ8_9ACTN|nr:gas vesicle protein GvpJ [Nonomuraea phyllanthi]KAB8197735.1 gas vesicle protein [Nonomuraea phyllanthi]QFY06288.1 gas vesicle protein [Nonomuraea phyllanthi]